MKARTWVLKVGVMLLGVILVGCGTEPLGGSLGATSTPTPDVQGTVEAALQATVTAEAEEEARIATAVAATQTAMATAAPEEGAAATGTPTPGAVAQPTPAPQTVSSETYVTMSEEELAALIDEAVNAAVAETEAAATATESATGDATVTQDEVETIEVQISGAEEAIALAEELLYVYADLYAEVATETLVMIDEMEALLAATTEMVVVMTDILVDVDTALEQNQVVSEQLIQDLEAAAIAAGAQALALQQEVATWPPTVEASLAQRANAALAVQATEVAGNRMEAIAGAYDYVEITREALSDRRLTAAELDAVAQTGANAVAGLQAQGGPQLQDVADQLNQVTASLARGQVPQVTGQLQALESALPARSLRP